MVVTTDNRDLAMERARLGLSQQDIADLLCGFDPTDPEQEGKGFSFSAVSRFETGDRKSMPSVDRNSPKLGRADYEALLERLKRQK